MRALKIAMTAAVGIALSSAPSFAQNQVMVPQAGCTATPAQLEANKKVAMAFFAPGADRVALADPSYKQHNPAFVKGGKEAGLGDYEVLQVAIRRSSAAGWTRPGRWSGRGSAASGGESARDRHGRVRCRDDHPQE